MKISPSLVVGIISAELLVGCAGTPKRNSALVHIETVVEKSQTSPPVPPPESAPKTVVEPPKPQPMDDSVTPSNFTPISESPITDQPVLPMESPVPPPKEPIPDLGRKLPKLIYSEELGLYTAPSTLYEIYFWNAQWFVRSAGLWFCSDNYRGPWKRIDAAALPEKIHSIKR